MDPGDVVDIFQLSAGSANRSALSPSSSELFDGGGGGGGGGSGGGGGGGLQTSNNMNSATASCSLHSDYLAIEAYCYLFIMCPMALVGIWLNSMSLRVFCDKSFGAVTFKYLRLVAFTDIFTCTIIIPYCVTAYTQPLGAHDMFVRHLYLAYLYLPGANLAINLNTFLNLLLTTERLVSVGWPMHKYTLFKPSRYNMSCVCVISLAVVFNIPNFLLYKIGVCAPLEPRSFTITRWWSVYGFVKEAITRIVPIIMLVLFNMALIYIVRSSRQRMKASLSPAARDSTILPTGLVSGGEARIIAKDFHSTTSSSNAMAPSALASNSNSSNLLKVSGQTATPTHNNNHTTNQLTVELISSNLVKKSTMKRNRSENQLTWMTIAVAVLYSASSIPMVFAYPGLLFSAEQTQTQTYKLYAVLVNILELIQCSFRFLIYFCFTTQFRLKFYELFPRIAATLRALSCQTLVVAAHQHRNHNHNHNHPSRSPLSATATNINTTNKSVIINQPPQIFIEQETLLFNNNNNNNNNSS